MGLNVLEFGEILKKLLFCGLTIKKIPFIRNGGAVKVGNKFKMWQNFVVGFTRYYTKNTKALNLI